MYLNNKNYFKEFFSTARKVQGPYFTSFYGFSKPHPQKSIFILSGKKKVDKRAVYRNFARRRLRAAIGEVLKNDLNPNCDQTVTWVISLNKKTIQATWHSLTDEVKSHWKTIQEKIKITEL